jgi:hypothetical protein
MVKVFKCYYKGVELINVYTVYLLFYIIIFGLICCVWNWN